MPDVVGPDELVVIANTGDDIEIYGALRLARPRPGHVLARRPDRRARLGARRRHLPRDGRAARARASRCGSTSAIATSRSGSSARGALRAGARLTEAHAAHRAPRWGCAARVLPMSDQPVRTRVLAHGRWWPFQEFMINGPGAGAGRRRRASAAPAPRRPTPEVLEAIAQRARDRDRPVEPGDLDRPDPRAAGPARGARAQRRRRSSPSARSSRGAGASRGRPRRSCSGPASPLDRAGVAALYAGLIDGLVADERRRATRCRCCETDLLMSTAGRAPARGGRRRSLALRGSSARRRADSVRRRCDRSRSCRSRASRAPSSAWPRTSLAGARGARSPRRCSPTCWSRCGASTRSTRCSS